MFLTAQEKAVLYLAENTWEMVLMLIAEDHLHSVALKVVEIPVQKDCLEVNIIIFVSKKISNLSK